MKNIINELKEYDKLFQDRRAIRAYDMTAKEGAELLHQEGGTFNAILQAYKIGFARGARFQAAKARKGGAK